MFRVNKWYKKLSLELMKKRLGAISGDTRDGRYVQNKLYSFRSTLQDAYQAETITLNGSEYRCLINPDKLKYDYDQKEISIDFESGLKEGDVFYWNRTNSYWITYLQDFCEEAYFRATIRRCNYNIEINGNTYWIYVRGPVETAIIWRQKHQIEMNDLNYSIMFYITSNEETKNFLSRFQMLKFDGHNWRVAATDKYSQPGLIEVYLEEYYDNEMADASIEPEEIKPDLTKPYIEGPQFVKPYDTKLVYSIVDATEGLFVVNSNKVKIVTQDDNSCELEILTGRAGKFNLTYMKDEEEIATLEVNIKSF